MTQAVQTGDQCRLLRKQGSNWVEMKSVSKLEESEQHDEHSVANRSSGKFDVVQVGQIKLSLAVEMVVHETDSVQVADLDAIYVARATQAALELKFVQGEVDTALTMQAFFHVVDYKGPQELGVPRMHSFTLKPAPGLTPAWTKNGQPFPPPPPT